ncbi:hypothetical protein DPMN_033798 [Dreissena polymorpha]|uniref:Uncharacterized protein n=1 Tax=Dreissena polymorpha TaxID=45954 RepID=A0A9D4M6D5_DREPO|nr:hypothetical protein DPMN_033798 [Dreissena polymorpha]
MPKKGLFFNRNRNKFKTEYTPPSHQQEPNKPLIVHRYYTSSKAEKTFKKRVTWLGDERLSRTDLS